MDETEALSLKQVELGLSIRIQRGEIEYNGRSVLVKQSDPRRIDPLIRCLLKGYLEQYHVDTGQRFKQLREVANSKSGIRVQTTYSGHDMGIDAATLYSRVVRALTKDNWVRIKTLCFVTQDIDGNYPFSDADILAIGSMSPFTKLHLMCLKKPYCNYSRNQYNALGLRFFAPIVCPPS